MPLKPSKGNMYDWVTHTHSHLGGKCPHDCVYCYVDNPRFGRHPKYQGKIRLIRHEFDVKYGAGKAIFVENCNDMFAQNIPHFFILKILEHCNKFKDNVYVFQTKNPSRYLDYLNHLPPRSMLGTTIETNRDMTNVSTAPHPQERSKAMAKIFLRKFVTIEPVLDFDVNEFASMIIQIRPSFVNIGADSKNHGLKEPTWEKIDALIKALSDAGIEIKEKHNLDRLKNK